MLWNSTICRCAIINLMFLVSFDFVNVTCHILVQFWSLLLRKIQQLV